MDHETCQITVNEFKFAFNELCPFSEHVITKLSTVLWEFGLLNSPGEQHAIMLSATVRSPTVLMFCLSHCSAVCCMIYWTTLQWHPIVCWQLFNTLRPRQNGRHFTDDIFKCIFLSENICISIKISLKFVPNGPITNIPAMFQVMAWLWPGDKPLYEPIIA